MLRIFSKKEKGASLVEYSVLVAGTAVGSMAAMRLLSNNISGAFSQSGSILQDVSKAG